MERLEGKDLLLFAYYHVAPTILHQLSFSVDLKRPIVAYRPLVAIAYYLQHV
jgi:hypothetical protein